MSELTLDQRIVKEITEAPKQRKARVTTPKANKAPKAPTTPKNAPKASKTVVAPIEEATTVVINFATITPADLKKLQQRVTKVKQVIAPTPPTPVYRVARRDESKDIMSKLLGMNAAYNEIKKRYAANAAYFHKFTDTPEKLNTERIASLMSSLKRVTVFFKSDVTSISPMQMLGKIVALALLDVAKFDSLRLKAEKLRTAK